MEIRDLSAVTLSELTSVFNSSFSDYKVKMQLTEEQLIHKIKADNIQLNLSYGAYNDGRLIAFVLNSSDDIHFPGVAYNAGTGVVPEFRKEGIAKRLYFRVFEILQAAGFDEYQLEVITENEKAIELYKGLGFLISRELGCYKGTPKSRISKQVIVREKDSLVPSIIREFWNSAPVWQNSLGSIERDASGNAIFSVYVEEQLAGYCILGKGSGRIHQIAVRPEFRKQGIGAGLMSKAQELSPGKMLFLLNADLTDSITARFFEQHGMEIFVKQYEMKKALKGRA